jgi:hypothetical protein
LRFYFLVVFTHDVPLYVIYTIPFSSITIIFEQQFPSHTVSKHGGLLASKAQGSSGQTKGVSSI